MLSASLLSLVWLPSQRAVCLPCQLQVSLPCPLEASLLSLERVWLLLSSQLALLRLSFRRLVSVPWQLGQQASPLQSSSSRPADPPVRVAILFTKTLSTGALKCSEASFRTVSRSGVPAPSW